MPYPAISSKNILIWNVYLFTGKKKDDWSDSDSDKELKLDAEEEPIAKPVSKKKSELLS